MPPRPLQLAVLISGGGTTLQNLIDCIGRKTLDARVVLVIASRGGIAGIDRALAAGLRYELVERKKFAGARDFSVKVFRLCQEAGADLICLGGWLSLLEIPPQWQGRIMNIHPALLPSFGGPGMYGLKVHQAVLDHGCKVSGCTVHFVDEQFDHGPIILQRACPVLQDDTPQTLAHRVFEEEKIAYPEAIRLYQAGRLCIEGRRVRIV
ncbi:MAG: phosphoribosylglycinamide formyltransferase [Tepidisphaeraceae bacterium]|jgi:phosphoribosylglycinamide formyltransferase-1